MLGIDRLQSCDIGRTAQTIYELDRALGVDFQRFRVGADIGEICEREISGRVCARARKVLQVGGNQCDHIFVAHEFVVFTSCRLHS